MEGTEPTWRRVEDPHEGADWVGPVAVGPDGTFWGVVTVYDFALMGFDGSVHDGSLVRFDGSEWSRWSLLDLEFAPVGSWLHRFEVASDASVWYAALDEDHPGDKRHCGGVGHFDGETGERYLPGICVEVIDINTDGSVWLLATEAGADLRDVYVITPEAVAGKE
jgi:hypothetical protein